MRQKSGHTYRCERFFYDTECMCIAAVELSFYLILKCMIGIDFTTIASQHVAAAVANL